MSLLPYGAALREFQVRYYSEAMVAAGGSVTRAAALCGRNRTEFYRALARVGLKPRDFRALRGSQREPVESA